MILILFASLTTPHITCLHQNMKHIGKNVFTMKESMKKGGEKKKERKKFIRQ